MLLPELPGEGLRHRDLPGHRGLHLRASTTKRGRKSLEDLLTELSLAHPEVNFAFCIGSDWLQPDAAVQKGGKSRDELLFSFVFYRLV